MNIQMNNLSWIEVEKTNDKEYHMTFMGDNGNLFQMMGISKKYLRQLNKEINRLLERDCLTPIKK